MRLALLIIALFPAIFSLMIAWSVVGEVHPISVVSILTVVFISIASTIYLAL